LLVFVHDQEHDYDNYLVGEVRKNILIIYWHIWKMSVDFVKNQLLKMLKRGKESRKRAYQTLIFYIWSKLGVLGIATSHYFQTKLFDNLYSLFLWVNKIIIFLNCEQLFLLREQLKL
jgi:hypothetical protein